jgi:hypothetical protein
MTLAMTREEAIAMEGDPNEEPWRNRPGGPRVEWVQVEEISPGDKLLITNKTIFNVDVCELAERGLWRLRIDQPTMAHTSTITRPQVVPPAMPKVRDLLLRPSALYRRLLDPTITS